jgi:hypothetical protein
LCRKFEGHKKNFEGEIFFVKNRIWKIFIYFGSILKVNFSILSRNLKHLRDNWILKEMRETTHFFSVKTNKNKNRNVEQTKFEQSLF